jgi:hypothetical protein
MEALWYKNHENPCDRKSHTFKTRAQIFVLIHQKVYQFKKGFYHTKMFRRIKTQGCS